MLDEETWYLLVFPINHEIITATESLNDVCNGNFNAAGEKLNHYADKSVIGSSCIAMHHITNGNQDEADRYASGAAGAIGMIAMEREEINNQLIDAVGRMVGLNSVGVDRDPIVHADDGAPQS